MGCFPVPAPGAPSSSFASPTRAMAGRWVGAVECSRRGVLPNEPPCEEGHAKGVLPIASDALDAEQFGPGSSFGKQSTKQSIMC